MQTCPLQTIPYFTRIHSLFLKIVLYEEYYADMSPSDDPLFRSNPFTFLKLSYMRSIMQTCPLQTILISLESIHFF